MVHTNSHPNRPSLIDSKVLSVSEVAPGYLRAIIDNPPINLFDPVLFAGLNLLQDYVEVPAHGVKVVVFESAHSDFFVAHLEFASMGTVPSVPGAKNLIEHWPTYSHRLTRSPAVSIAKVRGRARGIGNEFILACDMRFASREKARLCQIEIGFGMVPGGGGLEWLPRHVGRARALEIILSASDFDADTAEKYGWVNRSVGEAELDAIVDGLARRIATFDATAIRTVKSIVDSRFDPPAPAELRESFDAILRLAAGSASKEIVARLRAKAGGSLAPVELELPTHYGTPDP